MTLSNASDRARLRSVLSGSIGNLVEWYDWYAYSTFALYFAGAYFPHGDQTAQLLDAAAVFAVGFLMRPLGAWWIGRYADRHGRKSALVLSVVMMCGGSLAIALTPTYARIGVAAPVCLLLARMAQGLSVGGEYGTSATYLSEVAGRTHRGFYSSFQYVTLMAGQLLALAVQLGLQSALTPPQLRAWGWRVPFALGAVAAVVALLLRRSMEETVVTRRPDAGSLAALAKHPGAVLRVVGLTLGGTVAFYTFTAYAQKFLVNTAGFTREQSTRVSFLVLACALVLQPVVGALSDRIGRRPVMIAFGVGATLGTVPVMTQLAHVRSVGAAFALLMAAMIVLSGYTSINAVVKAELFPANVRALGVGLPYALTVAIFGGTAEYLALWARQRGVESWFYWYVTACVLVSLVTYVRSNDQRGRALDDG